METCTAESCEQPSTQDSDVGRLCHHHYMAWKRYGYIGSIQPDACSVEGCVKKALSRRLCTMHYARLRKTGSTDDAPRKNARKVCSVDGCSISVVADGFCDTHYRRMRRYGTTDIPTRPIEMGDEFCVICGSPLPVKNPKYCSEACREHGTFHTRQAGAHARNIKRYGITPEIFDLMLADQNGGCAICGTTEPGSGRERFAVDHCHGTGIVRGLLCIKCNSGLGQFKDDVSLLRKSIEYLEAPPSKV